MIRSTFAGFTTAQHALLANQRAIDVAGQNLSNQHTIGYTRQRLDLASITPTGPSPTNSPYDSKVGQGVLMTGVIQIRDPYLDIQYRSQIAKVGTVDAMDAVMEEIGNIFDEIDSTAIRAAYNDVVSQLTALANPQNASSQNLDALVRSSFEVLINLVHQNASELSELEEETADKLETSLIPNINTALEEIAILNESIKNTQIQGSPALELQDQRNQLLDDLATYFPIDVTYIEDTSPGVSVQLLQVTFTDADGVEHTLIHDDEIGNVAFGQDAATGDYTLTVTDALDPTSSKNVADVLVDGVLKGNLDMLNQEGIFNGGDVNGIGYYEKSFDLFVSTLAEQMNTLNGTPLFTTSDGSGVFTATNIEVSADWKNNTIGITKTHEVGPDGTPNSTDYSNVLKMINMLTEENMDFNFDLGGVPTTAFSGTLLGAYDNIQNVQAIERKATTTILESRLTVLDQIADSRDSVSAVSQDEEVMDLMRYQQAYNAASRVMTTMDELLDKLINGTGVVGR